MADSPEALYNEVSSTEEQVRLDRLFAIRTQDDRAIAEAVAQQELASQVGQGVKLAPDAAITAQIRRAAQFKVPLAPPPPTRDPLAVNGGDRSASPAFPGGAPTGRRLDSNESSPAQADTRPGGIDLVLERLIKELGAAWTALGASLAAAVVPPASPRRAKAMVTPDRPAAVPLPMNRSHRSARGR